MKQWSYPIVTLGDSNKLCYHIFFSCLTQKNWDWICWIACNFALLCLKQKTTKNKAKGGRWWLPNGTGQDHGCPIKPTTTAKTCSNDHYSTSWNRFKPCQRVHPTSNSAKQSKQQTKNSIKWLQMVIKSWRDIPTSINTSHSIGPTFNS